MPIRFTSTCAAAALLSLASSMTYAQNTDLQALARDTCGVVVQTLEVAGTGALPLATLVQIDGAPIGEGAHQGSFLDPQNIRLSGTYHVARPLSAPDAMVSPGSSGYVNLRAGGALDSAVIDTIGTPEYVHVACAADGWIRIRRASGQMAWVFSRFVGRFERDSRLAKGPSTPRLIASLRPPHRVNALSPPQWVMERQNDLPTVNIEELVGRDRPATALSFLPQQQQQPPCDRTQDQLRCAEGQVTVELHPTLKPGLAAVQNSKAAVLNVRAGPGIDYVTQGKLANGDKVTIVVVLTHWAWVQGPDGVAGYVYAKHLKQ